jgi:hypothetical protein
MKSLQFCIILAIVLGTLAVCATASIADDRETLVELLKASFACPREPFVVNGQQYHYTASYTGDSKVFRVRDDIKTVRVNETVNVNYSYIETLAFEFKDLDKVEIEGDGEAVSFTCKLGKKCVASTSTGPEEERQLPFLPHRSVYACDHQTAENIKLAVEGLLLVK